MSHNLINTLIKYLKQIRSPRLQDTELQDTDFSSFLSNTPLTHRQQRQQRIEECEKLGISTCIDNPSEQSEIFCGSASVPELERRLNAKKAIMNAENATKHSKWANFIAFSVLIVSAIALI